MKNFYVIGGQYESVCYGGTDTLQAAKVLATKNAEYWDNWQGWNTPKIYAGADCETIESKGRITTRDGETIIVPKANTFPAWIKRGERWTKYETDF